MDTFDFLPKNESDLLSWLINFSDLLPEEGKLLGITPAEISSLNALIFSVVDDIKNGRSEVKQTQRESMISFLKLIVYRIKKNPSYRSDEHGKRLGID